MARLIVALVLLATVTVPSLAQAKGTMRVQQSDGSVQVYDNVNLAVSGRSLQITTADKKGTLIVTDAACTLVDNVLRCLPQTVRLRQNGEKQLDFARGTVYFNTTDAQQQLTRSSTQIPPNGVLASLVSPRGTYVTLSGTLDSTSK